MSFFTSNVTLPLQDVVNVINAVNAANVSSFYINNEVFFDNELVDYINLQLVDSISPNVIYDMNRYINVNAIQYQPFYSSNFKYFNEFIYNIVINIDPSMSPVENHLMLFFSVTKKLYIYQVDIKSLSLLDNYVMDWMRMNFSVNDIAQYRNLVLLQPEKVKVFY